MAKNQLKEQTEEKIRQMMREALAEESGGSSAEPSQSQPESSPNPPNPTLTQEEQMKQFSQQIITMRDSGLSNLLIIQQMELLNKNLREIHDSNEKFMTDAYQTLFEKLDGIKKALSELAVNVPEANDE